MNCKYFILFNLSLLFCSFSFAQIPVPGNVLWLKADAAVYNDAGVTAATNGQTVQQWNDQSGNGNNVTQTVAGNKPVFQTTQIGGQPAIYFDGAAGAKYLNNTVSNLVTTGAARTTFIVSKINTASTTGGTIFTFRRTATIHSLSLGLNAGVNYVYTDGVTAANNASAPASLFTDAKNPFIATYSNGTGSQIGFRFNGIPQTVSQVGIVSTETGTAGFTIGGREDYANWWQGLIAEVIVYNRTLTVAEIQQVESYLQTKYTIASPPVTPRPGSGTASRLNGSTQYINIPDDNSLDFGSGDFTVQCWVKKNALTSGSNNVEVINKWTDGTATSEWWLGSTTGVDNIPSFYWQVGGTYSFINATTTLALNKWNHLSVTRVGPVISLYVNGILEATGNIGVNTINNVAGRNLLIAARNSGSGNYSAIDIDEVQIYKGTGLSQTTIREWMCKKITPSHPNYANLVSYYRFDEGTGTSLSDLKGTNHGALINAPTWVTSGAALGDVSAYDYTANVGTANINIGTPADNLTATMNTGTSAGVQVYAVNELPNNQNYPGVVGNNKYAGVFVVNGNGAAAYNATYNYTNNTSVTPTIEPNLKLFKRTDNAAAVWSAASNQTLNIGTKTITATGQNTEYVLASAIAPTPPTCALNLTGVVGTSTRIPYSSALNLTTAYTYEVWVKPSTDISTYRVILGRYATAVHNPTIEIEASGSGYDGRVSVWLHVGGVYNTLFSNTAVNDNQWHHIATTYDGAEMKLYIDGVLENSLAATGAITSSTDPLSIGYSIGFNLYPFIGKIDDVRIWDVARNLSQISATMNGSLLGNEAGLVANYDFNNGTYNGSGQTVPNLCTNANKALDGITTGTATNPTFDCSNTAMPAFVAPTCAAKFNGTNSYINVVNTPTATPTKGTIEFWMNQPSFSNWQIPIATFDPGVTAATFTDGMYFQTYADGSLYFIYASSISVYGFEIFGTLSTNRNYHVALSWDLTTNTIKGYLDGKIIFIKALTTTFPTTLPRFSLGGGFDNGRFYNGTLDEVRFWNVERTQNQLISKASDSLVGNEAGLQAYYRFNDNLTNGAGQAVTNYCTTTGAALNGTTVNYVKFPCTVNPPTCGITLSGAASEGVQIPHNAAFNSSTNITYEAWVKPGTDVATYRRIVGKGGNGTQEAPGIYVQQTTGKVSAGMLINGVQQIVTSSLAINDNEWHHTAFTYDGTTLKLYVDGTLDGTLTAVGTITTNTSPFDIGYNSPLNLYPFIGKIDDVRIWNTTRTGTEIQTSMNGSLLGNESGLVAYYHFNDNSRSGQGRTVTNFCTTTGSILNGSTFGTALTPVFECAPPPFTNPECNMVLNGTTDYVTVPNHAALNLSQFSIGAYVKTTDASANYKNIVWKDADGSNANYALYITNTNKAQFTFQRNPISGTAPNATGTTTITDGNWHYLVGTFDGSNLKMYVDGILEATTADASTVMTGSNPLYLGTSAGSNKYNGSMDEVSVWNTALTSTQITNLIGQQLAGNETNLVAYYNFDGITKNGQGISVINSCTATGVTLNGTTTGTTSTPIFTCSEIPVNDPACAILLNGYADAVTAVNGTNDFTYPAITQNFTMEIVAKPLLEKRGSGTGGFPIWPPGHYIQNGQVGQAFVIAPNNGNSLGAGHAGVGISLGTNGIGVYEGSTGYLQAPAVYNAATPDWSHITVVSENGRLKLYVNGAVKHTAAASGYILHPSIGLGGYTSPLTPNFAGYVSETRVWNIALTGEQIRNNINANLTGAEANLVSLYKLGTNTSNGVNQIITGSGSMAGSIVYKTVGSNYTPLFTCANTTNVPKDSLPGSGKMLTFTGNGLYSALNGAAFAELGNWGNAPAQGSIALWFNANTIKNNAVLFSTTHFRNQTGKHKGFDVFIKNNKLLLTIGTDTTVTGYQDTVTVLNSFNAGRWYHLTFNWDAGTNSYSVYINGLSVATGTSTFLPTKFESVKAGSGIVAGYTYSWDGLIDELSEWNKILTATEIKQQMCSKINTAQANYANVLHYYRFDNTTSSNNFISDNVGTAHGIYCLPFLYDYWIYGNGGPFYHDQIPAHHFTDLPTSSAPIGAYSSYQYAGNTSNTSLQIGNGQGGTDHITATINSGTADGIHIYGEDEWPNTVNGVNDTVPGSKRYAGVHMVNPNAAAYTLLYDYTNNPFVTPVNEPYLRLRKRDNNAAATWITPVSMALDQVLNTITCTGESTEYILAKGLFTLPLKWLSFTAQLNSNKQTALNWKVEGELNISRYDIEWSTDGIHFTSIATVNYNAAAKGHYKAFHIQPSKGNNYYRIRQMDVDGRTGYSNTQLIKLTDTIVISIYPNPANDVINIVGWNNISHMQLYDISGRKINEWQLAQPTISVNHLANGTYILKIELQTGEIVEQKVIVFR